MHVPISPERTLEDLVDIGVGGRLQCFGLSAWDLTPCRLRPDPAVPADLLHVIVELDAVAVGIERKRGVIYAGVEFRRDRVDEGGAARFQELDGRAQLRVAADLDPERHAGAALSQAQRPPQFLREEPQTVVLGAAAQEQAAGTAIGRLLATHKADTLGVEGFGALDIVDKQAERTDLGDLKRPRQQYAL